MSPHQTSAERLGMKRRHLLALGGAAVLGSAAASCERLGTEPDRRDEQRNDSGNTSRQAPMLADQVAAGDLPGLAERLPDRPLVVQPLDQVGVYGGDWRLAVTGAPGSHWLIRTIGYEHLVRWQPDVVDFSVDELQPNVAEGFDVDDESTEYTFHLRPGLKWSDGEPFTADDIVFAYEDVLLHEDLEPAVPSWLSADGKPATLEKLDDHTVRFQFTTTNSLFLQRIATPDGRHLTSYPAHYLKEFHAAYNEDAGQVADRDGYDSWADLFLSRADLWAHEGSLPTLNAWRITTPLTGSAQRVVAERNPYYWKVDPDGRQLPYIDRVVFNVIGDTEVIVLRMSNGELDLMDPFETELHDKPVLAQSRDTGDYDFVDTLPSWMNTMMLALNLTNEDPIKRELFTSLDFRVGLSHAINRGEIIDVVYQRQGEPWQGAPRPESTFYTEEMAKQYTEHSVEAANRYLDRVLPETDAQGVRLGPDGKPFSFAVDVATSLRPDWIDALELVKEHWRAVGVEMRINGMDRALFYERKAANLHDAAVWFGDGGLEVILEPRWYFPYSGESNFAIPWATWFHDPESDAAIEPPPPAKEQMELYRQLQTTTDPREQTSLVERILRIAMDEFWAMGISMLPEMYAAVTNRVQNMPAKLLNAWLYATPGPTNPPQYFIAQ